ncbi:enoyl-CoA delta isomerase 2-like [Hydra vulgaris]|uniref:Enoyl-CoA delta isomerase 2-like n=1 Tax=Hydra vulgaris TaxID=6087 RepID=A0ABM4DPH7_HYDVU
MYRFLKINHQVLARQVILIRSPLFFSNYYSTMEEAKKRVALLKEDPGNDAKLKLYGLFKQATEGKCTTKKPGMFDFVAQAKWNAWNELGNLTKEEAEKQYISFVDSLVGPVDANLANEHSEHSITKKEPTSDSIIITKEKGICTIKFNRPKKYNALTIEMYNIVTDTLNEAAKDPSINLVVITGEGDYYCSGNDLSNFANIPDGGAKKLASDSRKLLKGFVESFINFPKLLVCSVNGPAVGISVTLLGLADLVYAVENATFQTPFTTLGQSPEGCSSYTFPKIMGYAKANEMLLAGKKLTAREAFDRGLISEVIPHAEFHKTVQEKIKHLASLPNKSILYSKALNRNREKETLLKVNDEECVRLEERWLSDECMNAVMQFLSKKSKM